MAPVSTVTCALLSAFAAVARASNYKDAVVDLGYEIYEAASFDVSSCYVSATTPEHGSIITNTILT